MIDAPIAITSGLRVLNPENPTSTQLPSVPSIYIERGEAPVIQLTPDQRAQALSKGYSPNYRIDRATSPAYFVGSGIIGDHRD